jgi:hypothetical protein
VQDLTEETPALDLDAALARTRARHDELVHARNVRRRWVTGGALAVLLVAAAVIVPQLGSGTGQRVQVSDGGASASLPEGGHVPDGYRLSRDGDVWTLTLVDEPPTTSVPVGGEVGVADAVQLERHVEVDSATPGSTGDSVVLGFPGCSNSPTVRSVRYEQRGGKLLVDATLEVPNPSLSCAQPNAATIELPLPSPWVPGTPVTAAPL